MLFHDKFAVCVTNMLQYKEKDVFFADFLIILFSLDISQRHKMIKTAILSNKLQNPMSNVDIESI